MKTLYLLIAIYIGFGLIGCAATPQPNPPAAPLKTAQQTVHRFNDPLEVAVYTADMKPKKPYVIVGKETISKFNLGGIKRQEAVLRDTMRQLAASMGGDAVINVRNNDDTLTGTIISFDKKTLA